MAATIQIIATCGFLQVDAAQDLPLAVNNVTFMQHESQDVIISYDLIGDPEKTYEIRAYLVDLQNNKRLSLHDKMVSGDVGQDIRAGTGKQILWKLTSDFPGGLRGDKIVFCVGAIEQSHSSKWPWYLAGAVTAGVTGYLVYTFSQPKEDGYGTVRISVPDLP